ncbi:ribosome maturation factor RimP [Algivirga pacifica]|uniref:Ribosome maturation factor RimP n=1 Tax=Algivirga pacifica TaxID=1162670 RepID=A0ABP9DT82_9BACT
MMMDLRQEIERMVEEYLEESEVFIVDIEIKGTHKMAVVVTLDAAGGVPIELCAKVSRKLGNELEERELISAAYNLEVSSAGVGTPLKLYKQYEINVGRKLKVSLKDGKTFEGKLEEVKEEAFKITAEIKEKGKKKVKLEEMEIPFEELSSAEVMVSFK